MTQKYQSRHTLAGTYLQPLMGDDLQMPEPPAKLQNPKPSLDDFMWLIDFWLHYHYIGNQIQLFMNSESWYSRGTYLIRI